MIRTESIPASIVTRNVADLGLETGNVYEALSVISKRANQISIKLKQELNEKLAEFATTADNLEEVFENREQIEVSKQYERLPKPATIAIEEYTRGELVHRLLTPEEEQEALAAAAQRALERPMRRM